MTSPMIPALNDHEMEAVLERSAAAGATGAGYVALRLPREIADLLQVSLSAPTAEVHWVVRDATEILGLHITHSDAEQTWLSSNGREWARYRGSPPSSSPPSSA